MTGSPTENYPGRPAKMFYRTPAVLPNAVYSCRAPSASIRSSVARDELPVILLSRCQPDTGAIVDEHLQIVGAALRKPIGVVPTRE